MKKAHLCQGSIFKRQNNLKNEAVCPVPPQRWLKEKIKKIEAHFGKYLVYINARAINFYIGIDKKVN